MCRGITPSAVTTTGTTLATVLTLVSHFTILIYEERSAPQLEDLAPHIDCNNYGLNYIHDSQVSQQSTAGIMFATEYYPSDVTPAAILDVTMHNDL